MSQADGTNALSGWTAAGLGALLSVPLVTAAVFFLSRAGLGDPERDLTSIAISVGVFAVIPAALTAWGLARVVARGTALAAPGTLGVLRGAVVGAPAGVGLVILAALPLGHLPRAADGAWWWVIGLGMAVGALLGAVIGALAEPVAGSDALAGVAADTTAAFADRPRSRSDALATTAGSDPAGDRAEVGDARRDSHPRPADAVVVQRTADADADADAALAPASSASAPPSDVADVAAPFPETTRRSVAEVTASAKRAPAGEVAAADEAAPAATRHRRKRKRKRKGKRRRKR